MPMSTEGTLLNGMANYWYRSTLEQIHRILTWIGFEAAKTAPWPSLGLHHFG